MRKTAHMNVIATKKKLTLPIVCMERKILTENVDRKIKEHVRLREAEKMQNNFDRNFKNVSEMAKEK